MDNTISKLLDFFKHIVRDLLTYILSGLVVIINFAYVMFHLNKVEFKILFDNTYAIWLIVIFAYIIGHIIMGMMFLFLEKTKIDDFLNNHYNINIDQENEIKIYKKDINLYEFFIERQNQLYYLRWNLAGAFLFNGIINFYLLCTYPNPIFSYLTLISILSSGLLLLLHYKTAEDYTSTIKNCQDKNGANVKKDHEQVLRDRRDLFLTFSCHNNPNRGYHGKKNPNRKCRFPSYTKP